MTRSKPTRVPFLDVGAAYRELQAEIDGAIKSVHESGRYLLGSQLDAFEDEFAAYVGTKYCIGVGSGLDALTLILTAMGIGLGDEVLVPANTFIATWLAVSQVGARPVPVEPRMETHNLNPDGIAAAITPRTRAIIPVHLYGQPSEMDKINRLATEHGLFVIEDAAQAHGASYKGHRAGKLARAAAWSFYPAKNLGAISDGGAITTDDSNLAAVARLLRNYGSPSKYMHDVRGVNSRLDEIQSAVLRVKLQRLDEWNERRRFIASLYLDGLRDTRVTLTAIANGADPVWHLFVVRLSRRDELMSALADRGIECLIHYPLAPHLQRAYQDLNLPPGSFPIAERLQGEVLSLPIGPHVSAAEAQRVVNAVRDIAG